MPPLADASLAEPLAALLRTVAEEADQRGLEAALVGGAVRDLLLGREPLDLDVAVAGDAASVQDLAVAIARRLGGRPEGHPSFGTASLPLRLAGCPTRLDLAMRRRESYPRPGALPRVTPGSSAEDLQRRDFTVNAIGWPLRLPPAAGSGGAAVIRIADLSAAPGALDDLSLGLIRVLHPISFLDDPTRIFRAVRLAARLGFVLEPETWALAVQAVAGSALDTISPARLAQEVRLTATTADTPRAFGLLDELGVWRDLIPGWTGPPSGLANASPSAIGRQPALAGPWAALDEALTALPDARASARIWLARLLVWLGAGLRVGAAAAAAVPVANRLGITALREQAIIDEGLAALPHLRETLAGMAAGTPPSGVDRVLATTPPPLQAALYALSPEELQATLRRYWLALRTRPLQVSGRDLRAAGYPPGPALAATLAALRRRVLDGEAPSRQGQVEWLKEHLPGSGPATHRS